MNKMKCEYCGCQHESQIEAMLCEALTEWEDACQYKDEYLREKHGDLERIKEIRKKMNEVKGQTI